MQKLEPHNHIEATRETLSRILAKYGVLEFTFEALHEGIENTSVLVKTGSNKYVLRTYSQKGKSDDDIELELRFQDFMREAGIPIPAVFTNSENERLTVVHVDGRRWQSILLEFLEGESVTRNPTPALISELATLQANMHMLGMDFAKTIEGTKSPWTKLRDTLAAKIEKESIAERETIELIERIKSYEYSLPVDLPCGYNHLDIDFDGNVVTSANKVVGIIDFDDVQYSPLVVCLGYTLWCLLDDEGEEAMWAYLHAYEKVRQLSAAERDTLPNVVFFRNYILAAMRLLLRRDTMDIEKSLMLENEIPKIFIRTRK